MLYFYLRRCRYTNVCGIKDQINISVIDKSYPSTSSRHAFSISYEVNLDFYQSDNATPVYLGDVVFYHDILLTFSDSSIAHETPKRCTIRIGDRIIADSDVDFKQ